MKRSDWLLLCGLVALGLLPAMTGTISLANTATAIARSTSGEELNVATYVKHPAIIAVHVICGVGFALLGALQVTPGFRARRLKLHRQMGRALVAAAYAAALTALWMNQTFPSPLGPLKYWSNLIFGLAMLVALTLSMAAIRRRDIAAHRIWMLRSYAIGLGAGTQRLMFLPWFAVTGKLDPLAIGLMLWAGWLINLAVAEWAIRKPQLVRRRPATA